MDWIRTPSNMLFTAVHLIASVESTIAPLSPAAINLSPSKNKARIKEVPTAGFGTELHLASGLEPSVPPVLAQAATVKTNKTMELQEISWSKTGTYYGGGEFDNGSEIYDPPKDIKNPAKKE